VSWADPSRAGFYARFINEPSRATCLDNELSRAESNQLNIHPTGGDGLLRLLKSNTLQTDGDSLFEPVVMVRWSSEVFTYESAVRF
jgi:hypothetical protein